LYDTAASYGCVGIEAEPHERISQGPGKGRSKIDPNDHDAPGVADPSGNFHDLIGIQVCPEGVKVFQILLNAVSHTVGDTLMSLFGSFHRGIWRDLGDKMLAKILGKIREFFITESLDGANDRCRVNIVSTPHFARREKEGLVRFIEDLAKQPLSARAQIGLGA
jgi:hypothetical protein